MVLQGSGIEDISILPQAVYQHGYVHYTVYM